MPDSIATLDMGEPRLVRRSYLLRALAVALFGPLFAALLLALHPELPLALDTFVGLSLPGVPGVVSVLLLLLDVLLVLTLHELVHAAVYWLSCGAPPDIGVRGPILYAAAPGYLVGRNWMIANALAPFVVLSTLAIALLALFPTVAPWLFIPAVVNAASAAGDFMTVQWLVRLPATARIEDDGTRMEAFV